MIRDFENWNTTLGELSNLEELQGARVGIDAADYIYNRILHRAGSEPLVPALGGLPLGLRKHIEDDLQYLSKYGIEAFFIFSGLDLAKQDDPFRERQLGAEVNAAAWSLYDNHQAEESVSKFGQSPYVTPEDLFPALQAIFVEHSVKFLVAPYSAWAELAYLEKNNHVQAISGSSEILLFDCDKVITKWEFESGTFTWIKRARCIADLKKFVSNGDISDDMFVDACMLAGNHFLPTLPNLDSQNRKEVKPLGAINMMISNGRTGISVVLNSQDDPRFQRIDYLDRFRRARLAVKHHPILTVDGHIKPLLDNETPNNTNEVRLWRMDTLFDLQSGACLHAKTFSMKHCLAHIPMRIVNANCTLAYWPTPTRRTLYIFLQRPGQRSPT
ncbi:PIN domain-like protein [Lophiotrema nucula]|uniref:PIN domain-like protein n=1 Tax=Lophiotrema nucula TaxID=690887 RepID=A0A6A5YWU8_9PLEO|nr:PIN domain-like protein [Lophiotrema nucula]